MRINNRINWGLAFLLLLAMAFMYGTRAEASGGDRGNNDCNGVGNCNDIEIEVNEGGDGYGGDGGEGGSATSDASSESEANSTSSAGAEAGASVVNNITGDTIPADTTHRAKITLENTPDIVTITPGSGDSCKAHIGFGASIPGVGASMNIPLPGKECRKLKAYDRAMAAEQWQAAEIMFCSLKEVKAEFRSFGLDCVDILTLYVVPGPEPVGVMMTHDEYHELTMTQVSQEEYREQAELVEYRYTQQQSLIEALEEEAADDDAEIERLKKRVNNEVSEADARRAAVRAKIAAKEADEDGSENPDK